MEGLDLASSVWILDLDDELVFSGGDVDADLATGNFGSAGKSRRSGVDFYGRYQLADWAYLDYDLAWASPRLKGGGSIPLAPKLYMNGGLTFEYEGSGAALRFRNLADRPATEDGSIAAARVDEIAAQHARAERDGSIQVDHRDLEPVHSNVGQGFVCPSASSWQHPQSRASVSGRGLPVDEEPLGPAGDAASGQAFVAIWSSRLGPPGRGLRRGLPVNGQLLLRGRTLAKVEVDQRLIGDPGVIGESAEVRNRVFVQPDRDLPFQPSCIRVLLALGEVIALPHRRLPRPY